MQDCDAVSLNCQSQHPSESALWHSAGSTALPACQHVLTSLTPGNLKLTLAEPSCDPFCASICCLPSVVWKAPELSLETKLPWGCLFSKGIYQCHNVIHLVLEVYLKEEKKKKTKVWLHVSVGERIGTTSPGRFRVCLGFFFLLHHRFYGAIHSGLLREKTRSLGRSVQREVVSQYCWCDMCMLQSWQQLKLKLGNSSASRYFLQNIDLS